MFRLTDFLGIRPAARVTAMDDIRKGTVLAEGKLTCPAPIASPIKGRKCAGFFYRASHLGWRTVGPATRKRLIQVCVYASPLTLSLAGGGELLLVPRRADDFDAEGHLRLARQDLPGFLAKETLLLAGASVQVHGKARLREQRWTLVFDQITPNKAAPAPRPRRRK